MVPSSDAADAHALEVLAQVRLNSLKATPGTIEPFAASEIAWNVSGPGGFAVRLDSTTVPRIGEKLVTPLTSRAFQLRASAGRFTQVLGTVTVTVDQTACAIIPVPNHVIETTVRAAIDQLLAKTKGASRRRDDIVKVDETGIDIDLAFRKEVPVYPPPDVDIKAHWRYRVFNGQLVEKIDRLDVSVSFAWYLWLAPWNYPGLPLAVAIAEDNLRSDVSREAAEGADGLESFVDFGRRILSVQHTPTNFEMLACPTQALRHLLLAGAAVLGVASKSS